MKTAAAIGFVVVIIFLGELFYMGAQNGKTKSANEHPQQTLPDPVYPPGAVAFTSAGVMLFPGNEWEHLAAGSLAEKQVQSICLPVLNGLGNNNGSVIQVFTTANYADAQTATAILQKTVDADPSTMRGTFKQDDFNTTHGIHGVQVSYEYKTPEVFNGRKIKVKVYLFQNKKKNCIAINYIALAGMDSERVDQMIQDTLTLN